MRPAPAQLQASSPAAMAIRRGHPWIYREGLTKCPNDLPTGSVVDVVDTRERFLARGLYDHLSPIAVRLFQQTADEVLDSEFLIHRIEDAIRFRERCFSGSETTAYRLCNGEGDRLPGLVLDRYESVAIARFDSEMWSPWFDTLLDALRELLTSIGVHTLCIRAEAPSQGSKIRTLFGAAPADRVLIREHGMAMEVDLHSGQKTGAFLDQRENRARVRKLADGKASVLNLFSYAGGFSFAAALGGAARVVSVDSAAAAHATAQRSFRANGLDPARHAFVTADVFAYLEHARARGDRFDLVISDPPSFAPSERAKPRAMSAYRRLHASIMQVLQPRAILCAASCSSHVSTEDFLSTLDDAAIGPTRVCLREIHGQPLDHPTLPAWPEGRYLKFAVLA